MQEKIDAIVKCDSEFNEEFANRVLKKAFNIATDLRQRVFLVYNNGFIFYVAADEMTSTDYITYVDSTEQ